MNSQSNNKIIDYKYIYIVALSLISIKLWSFRIVPDKIYDGLQFLSIITLFIIVFVFSLKEDNTPKLFKTNVHLFIWIPIISSFAAAIFHDQSLMLSLLILRTNFFWLLYFVLHIFNISSIKIIRLMIFLGLGWMIITIIQQFTYPLHFFYNRTEEDNYDFYRAGVYRFMIDQHQYGLFVIIYYYNKFLNLRKYIFLFPVLLGLVGYYYYSGRQYALAAAACLAFATLSQKGSFKIYASLGIAFVVVILYSLRDFLFGDYIEMTNEQLQSDDDVRMVAAKFFLFDYWPHWITMIIGNGYENYKSSYGQEMLYINEVKLLFRSDVGIIGVFNMFGIFYVINILWLNIKGMKNKYYKKDTQYLKLIFINALLLLPLSEAYSVPSGAVPFFCLCLYLVEKSSFNKAENGVSSDQLHSKSMKLA